MNNPQSLEHATPSSRRFRIPLIVAACIAVLHFALSWIAFSRSAVIKPSEVTSIWRGIAETLAFPLVYLSNVTSALDVFPILMIANSVLWGIVVAVVVMMLTRPRRAAS